MNINRLLVLLTITLLALALTACDTLEVGVENPGKEIPATSTPIPESLPTSSPTTEITEMVETPTSTPTFSPRATSQPPTATPTHVSPSPTPVPPTATATPRPLLPTSTPAPAAERIRFPAGATQTSVEGYLSADETKTYVLGLAAGQFVELNVAVGTMGEGLRFSIVGADGAVVKPMGDAHVRTVVPSTQDYYVELLSDMGAVNYNLSVLVPVRVRFAPGGTATEVTGSLGVNGARHYVIHVAAGQRMTVVPEVAQGHVRMIISGADGQVFLSGRVGPPDGSFDGVLPVTQDYLIAVRPEGETGAAYTLGITIPPL